MAPGMCQSPSLVYRISILYYNAQHCGASVSKPHLHRLSSSGLALRCLVMINLALCMKIVSWIGLERVYLQLVERLTLPTALE